MTQVYEGGPADLEIENKNTRPLYNAIFSTNKYQNIMCDDHRLCFCVMKLALFISYVLHLSHKTLCQLYVYLCSLWVSNIDPYLKPSSNNVFDRFNLCRPQYKIETIGTNIIENENDTDVEDKQELFTFIQKNYPNVLRKLSFNKIGPINTKDLKQYISQNYPSIYEEYKK